MKKELIIYTEPPISLLMAEAIRRYDYPGFQQIMWTEIVKKMGVPKAFHRGSCNYSSARADARRANRRNLKRDEQDSENGSRR